MFVDLLVIGGAIGGVFGFYGRLKREFDPKYHPLAKLVSFKGIVILLFLQDIIFGFLNSKLFQPSATITFDDLYFGMPLLLTAIEATFVSFIFHWAFSSRLYHEDNNPGQRRMPIGRAILDSLNLSDIVRATITAFRLMMSSDSGAIQFGSKSHTPSRQRTLQLDNMGREPLNQPQYGHGYSNSEADTRYEPPSYPPSTRRYSSGAPPAFQQQEAERLAGRGKYGYESVARRDLSPAPDYSYPMTPRDVV